jgi:hypothetical protein
MPISLSSPGRIIEEGSKSSQENSAGSASKYNVNILVQPRNAPFPTDVMDSGIETSLILVKPTNASSPMPVIPPPK